jgi:uncharacterized protein
MRTAPDQERIAAVCGRLLADRSIPLVVVTVPSMAAHSSQSMGIEAFTRRLFDQWGAGQQLVHGVSWTRGILLLVSREDRKARIELGMEWDATFDGACKSIMDEVIIPGFRRGNYSGGIADGVAELDRMARGQRPPSTGWGWLRPYNPTASPWFILVFFVLAGVMRIWRFISYHSGYGRTGRGYYDDPYLHSSRVRPGRSPGGMFSGGSSGGGSSRGGGATGSW